MTPNIRMPYTWDDLAHDLRVWLEGLDNPAAIFEGTDPEQMERWFPAADGPWFISKASTINQIIGLAIGDREATQFLIDRSR